MNFPIHLDQCLWLFMLHILLIRYAGAILCYQCDSNEDGSCPSSQWFDKNLNELIDCSSFDAVTPGTFCVKIVQQSPGWGAWIKVTRRCGSRGFNGLTYGCRYWYEDNGVFKEECYCTSDGCNAASWLRPNFALLLAAVFVLLHHFTRLRCY